VSAQEYRRHAAKCLELADRSIDPSIRLGLLDTAHAWLRPADQAEKNADVHRAQTPSAGRSTSGDAISMQPGWRQSFTAAS